MKVLMLGWELPPHNSGGLGVACLQLSKALANSGADIDFVVPYDMPHEGIDFMRVHPATPKGVAGITKGTRAYDSYLFTYADGRTEEVSLHDQYFRYAAGVDSIIDTLEFDIIHAHDWLTFRGAIRAKQRTGKPLIVHIHATEFDRAGAKSGNPFVTDIEYTGMMIADRIIAVSQVTKDVIVREYGISPDKIDVVHNSIDPSYYEMVETANEYAYLQKMKSQGYRVVTNVGRLTVQKGLYNFLIAAKEVVARAPKTLFMIVGSGEQLFELIDHAAGLGIARNVLFVDFQRGKRLRDAFAISDLFVMPSVSEPFGLVPLEAIYYGTPVMVTYQSGVSEVLTHCLKVDSWDIQSMANQITAVVRSDALRDTLHQGSLQDFYKLSWSDAAQKVMGMYASHTGVPA